MECVNDRPALMKGVKLMVVKIGTSSITDSRLALSASKIDGLVDEVAALVKKRVSVILVSSGAIGAGMGKLGLKRRPRDINKLQAMASIGQNELMKCYGKSFKRHGIEIAQILLTQEDFRDRRRYLNVRNTVQALLELKIVPIINENDTIGVEEIRVGDNDTLSSIVASNLGADALVMLSSVDGLYTRDPEREKNAEKISIVWKINTDIDKLSGKASGGGVGSIQTKVKAAKMATKSGVPVILASASESHVLQRIIAGEDVGTIFMPSKCFDSRLHWILYQAATKGCIRVDDGAVDALRSGKASLLPSGIIGVEGEFRKGDILCIQDANGIEFARGISNYCRSDVEKIKGRQSSEIEELLGKKSYKEVVYSDNMALR
ncbi:glutamate 5-kinase [Candidatus Altiarchaeota archaeon]